MRQFDYTKLAGWSWSMETVTLLGKIHEAKGRQELYIRQKPRELTTLTELARIQSTEASNAIEGIHTESTRLRQLMEDKTTPRTRSEEEILGYRDVLNTIHENYEYIPPTPNYILQLHRDLLRPAGLTYGGSWKNVPNEVIETLADGTRRTRFVPLQPLETPEAMEQICGSYRQVCAAETVDSLLLMGNFVLDFLCIHPFNDGNGRMSRLLTLLLLYRSGYVVGKYISIEKKIEENKTAYYDALLRAGENWHSGENDPAPFINYLLKILLACYMDFEERVQLAEESGAKSTAYDITKAYAERKLGKFTVSELLQERPALKKTAAQDALKRLIEEGIVVRQGKGKATVYVRAEK